MVLSISELTKPVIKDAIASPLEDFEDAIIEASAQKENCAYIVTRNIKDFKKSRTNPIDLKLFLATL